MQKLENTWVRVAVIRNHDTTLEDPPIWRFYLDRKDPYIEILDWSLEGEVLPGVNHMAFRNPRPEKDPIGIAGLKAAIDVYGDVMIDDNLVARITLKNPAS